VPPPNKPPDGRAIARFLTYTVHDQHAIIGLTALAN
jgi:hypothetical protein